MFSMKKYIIFMIIDYIIILIKKIAVEYTIIIFLNKYPNPRRAVNAESRKIHTCAQL